MDSVDPADNDVIEVDSAPVAVFYEPGQMDPAEPEHNDAPVVTLALPDLPDGVDPTDPGEREDNDAAPPPLPDLPDEADPVDPDHRDSQAEADSATVAVPQLPAPDLGSIESAEDKDSFQVPADVADPPDEAGAVEPEQHHHEAPAVPALPDHHSVQ